MAGVLWKEVLCTSDKVSGPIIRLLGQEGGVGVWMGGKEGWGREGNEGHQGVIK